MTKERGRGTYSEDTARLLEMIGQRPIAYHPEFARRFGVKAAILLGQLLYWHGKQHNPDGWIRKTAQEIDDETALSEREQETARVGLVRSGCIEYKRMGMPAMPHYRVKHEAILERVLSFHVPAERPNLIGQNVLTCEDVCRGDMLGQNVLTNTESTQETTSEITAGEECSAHAPPPSADIPVPDALKNQPAPPRKREPKHSPANITESDDKRIASYLELCRSEITPTNAGFITERVSLDHADTWREICARWAENGWNALIVANMFEAYDRAINAERVKAMRGKSLPKAQPAPKRGRTYRRPIKTYTEADYAAANRRAAGLE